MPLEGLCEHVLVLSVDVEACDPGSLVGHESEGIGARELPGEFLAATQADPVVALDRWPLVLTQRERRNAVLGI
jgi:hypothetical protein